MYKISKGVNGLYGVNISEAGVQFCFSCCYKKSVLLCIYDMTGKELLKVDMLQYRYMGNVFSVLINGLNADEIKYHYLVDDKYIADPYMVNSENKHKWGEVYTELSQNMATLPNANYNWDDDVKLNIPYEEVIAYSLHVRGFTKHSSSKIQHKGTYKGIVDKIKYLNDLGINQLILMPAYDFEETLVVDSPFSMSDKNKGEVDTKINYWGFTKANYYLPKPEYSYSDDFVNEYKDMIKSLHSSGIEVIMQMYFPEEFNKHNINDVLKFWIINYHVDGFMIMGSDIDCAQICSDPCFADIKLYYQYDLSNYSMAGYPAVINDDYKNCVRKFAKGDDDSASGFIYMITRSVGKSAPINYLASYEGFTLYDTVSFDYKHNEDNGEDNRDGNNHNNSWNCGVEGITRKNSVNLLRLKQLKNMFTMLLTSQAVPMILSGDEFMNSQKGNNNAYCQDNEIGWVNWNSTAASKELYEYVKNLIKFRKNNKLLRLGHELTFNADDERGFPEISLHSEQAWFYKDAGYVKNIGLMLHMADETDGFIYLAYNMHWNNHDFGLPRLPKGYKWDCVINTDHDDSDKINKLLIERQDEINVPARTSIILKAVKI